MADTTHEIVFYGGNRERVTVIADETETLHGFLYGRMQVESDGRRRWIHFGRYNAVACRDLALPSDHLKPMLERDPDAGQTRPTPEQDRQFRDWAVRNYGEHVYRRYMGEGRLARSPYA